jgi:fructoselysine 6-phosphate deglycase
MEIKSIVAEILKNKEEAGGVKEVYFAACGGSNAALWPAKYMLEAESKSIRTGAWNANEFNYNPPAVYGENSVLVVASQKGDTPETVNAAKNARAKGVPVIGLTFAPQSELAKNCDYVLVYTFGPDKDIAGEKTVVALEIAAEFLHQAENWASYDKFMDGKAKIDGIVKKAQKMVEKRAEAFAQEYKDDSVIYTMASGAGYGAAYMESICIFMEMQWINSSTIHTGEYFHGPFEITDNNTAFMIQMSEGKTRFLDERALTFLKKYGKRFEVLDAKDLGLSTIDPAVVDYFNHSLFNNVYSVYNKHLAEARKHPLSTRRYMWKVQY